MCLQLDVSMSVLLIVCALMNCQRYMEGCECDGRSCSLVCAAVQLFKNRHAAVLVHQKTQSAGNFC